MKNKLKSIIRYTLLIYTTFLLISLPINIYAQPNSQAEIEITAGIGPTIPVNPENPGENLPDTEGVPGSLVIVNVTNFDFGTISVSQTTGTHNIITNEPHIQVVDLRGTHAGWSVSASVTPFKTSGGASSLPSAVIHITNGRPNSLISNLYAPSQVSNVKLTTDNATVKVITAPDGTGMGLWVMRWYPPSGVNDYIKLEIPAGAATTGIHTATINWILSNIP